MVTSVNGHRLTSLGTNYQDPEICDGSQWYLRIEQATSRKLITFNNAFPNEVKSFAKELDETLQAAGLPQAKWTALNEDEMRKYRQELSGSDAY